MGLLSNMGWSKKTKDLLGLAGNGDAEAQYELGMRLLKGIEAPENQKLGIDWLIKSSKNGNEDAQYLLGQCYSTGTGVEEDHRVALGFYTKSAKAANKYAQFELGEHYFEHDDFDTAVEWYKRSARQEHAPAQYALGICYYYGRGTIKAEDMGISWLEKAASRGHDGAKRLLRKLDY